MGEGLLVLVCDGDETAGLGHVSRCVGIAEKVMQQGWEAEFVGKFNESALKMIRSTGSSILSDSVAPEDPEIASYLETSLKTRHGTILIDSYRIDDGKLELIRELLPAFRIVSLDDVGALDKYPCDAILNFTTFADGIKYPNRENLELYLGLAYFPAREWLRNLRVERQRKVFDFRSDLKALVSLGAQDPHSLLLHVVESLSSIAQVSEITVVADDKHVDVDSIDRLLMDFRGKGRRFPIQPSLESLFGDCNVVVSAGGLTKYESMYLGLPTLVINQTEIQSRDTQYFIEQGMLFEIGDAENLMQLGGRYVSDQISSVLCDHDLLSKLSVSAALGFEQSAQNSFLEVLSGLKATVGSFTPDTGL